MHAGCISAWVASVGLSRNLRLKVGLVKQMTLAAKLNKRYMLSFYRQLTKPVVCSFRFFSCCPGSAPWFLALFPFFSFSACFLGIVAFWLTGCVVDGSNNSNNNAQVLPTKAGRAVCSLPLPGHPDRYNYKQVLT